MPSQYKVRKSLNKGKFSPARGQLWSLPEWKRIQLAKARERTTEDIDRLESRQLSKPGDEGWAQGYAASLRNRPIR